VPDELGVFGVLDVPPCVVSGVVELPDGCVRDGDCVDCVNGTVPGGHGAPASVDPFRAELFCPAVLPAPELRFVLDDPDDADDCGGAVVEEPDEVLEPG